MERGQVMRDRRTAGGVENAAKARAMHALGKSNRDIARDLKVTERTVGRWLTAQKEARVTDIRGTESLYVPKRRLAADTAARAEEPPTLNARQVVAGEQDVLAAAMKAARAREQAVLGGLLVRKGS